MAGKTALQNATVTLMIVGACLAVGLWPTEPRNVHAQGGTISGSVTGPAGPQGVPGPTGAAGNLQRTDVTIANPATLGTSSGTATTLIPAQGANTLILPSLITLNQIGNPLWTNTGTNTLSFFEAFDINDWSGIVNGGALSATYWSNNPVLTFAGSFAGINSFIFNKPLTVFTDSTITGTGGAWHFTIYWTLWTGP